MPATYTSTELAFLPATKIAALIQTKAITSQEITQIYIDRIGQYNSSLNAIVISLEKEALERAKAADRALAAGENWGILHGVPMTVKESFNIKGQKTTVNFKRLSNYVATEHSVVVQKLYDEGAIILGKTNIPTLLSDHQTYGPLYPRANNPFDQGRTTGGSTGGGASALAAGLSSLEIGSDIGGSVRIPAHYCGLYSLKTTEKAISRIGHLPPLPNAKGTFAMMAIIGPLARSIDDLSMAFDLLKEDNLINEKEEREAWSIPKTKSLSNHKLAWTTSINNVKTSLRTQQLIQTFIQKLKEENVSCKETMPKIDYQQAEENWGNIFGAYLGQDLPWLVQQIVKLQQTYSFASRPKGKYIARGVGAKKKKLATFLALRQNNIRVFNQFFQTYDFLLCPVAAGAAFKHCKTGAPIPIDGQNIAYWDMGLTFVFLANVLGFPAMVIPLGQTTEGLPIGLQIIGSYGAEKALLAFGKLIEPFIQGFRAPNAFK